MNKLFLLFFLIMPNLPISTLSAQESHEIIIYNSCDPDSKEIMPAFAVDLAYISRWEIRDYKRMLDGEFDLSKLIIVIGDKMDDLESARKNAYNKSVKRSNEVNDHGRITVLRQVFSFDECKIDYRCYMMAYPRP